MRKQENQGLKITLANDRAKWLTQDISAPNPMLSNYPMLVNRGTIGILGRKFFITLRAAQLLGHPSQWVQDGMVIPHSQTGLYAHLCTYTGNTMPVL